MFKFFDDEAMKTTIAAQQILVSARNAVVPNSNDFSEPVEHSVDAYVSTYQYQCMRILTDPIEQIKKIRNSEESYAKFPKDKKEFNKLIRYFFNIISMSYIDYDNNITQLPNRTYRAVTQTELDNIVYTDQTTIKTLCSVSTDKESCIEYFKYNKRLKSAIIVYETSQNIPHIRVNETLVNYKNDTLNSYGTENEIIITSQFEIVSIERQENSYNPPIYIAKIEPLPLEKNKDISYTSLTEKYRKVVKDIGINGQKVNDFLYKYNFNKPDDDPDFIKWTNDLIDFIESMKQFIRHNTRVPYRIQNEGPEDDIDIEELFEDEI